MRQGPVISELARRWVRGEVDTDEYYETVWRDAVRRARRDVRARIEASSNGMPPRPRAPRRAAWTSQPGR